MLERNKQAIVIAAVLISGIAIGIVFGTAYHATYPDAEIAVIGVDGDDILTGSVIEPLTRTTQIEFTVPANTTEVHVVFTH